MLVQWADGPDVFVCFWCSAVGRVLRSGVVCQWRGEFAEVLDEAGRAERWHIHAICKSARCFFCCKIHDSATAPAAAR